jgi:hypothetical protein
MGHPIFYGREKENNPTARTLTSPQEVGDALYAVQADYARKGRTPRSGGRIYRLTEDLAGSRWRRFTRNLSIHIRQMEGESLPFSIYCTAGGLRQDADRAVESLNGQPLMSVSLLGSPGVGICRSFGEGPKFNFSQFAGRRDRHLDEAIAMAIAPSRLVRS